jgi:ABC-type transport system involved in multi-copper enzyme maturation permease subunit
MSISAPRYAAGPLPLVSRPRRALAIYLEELGRLAGWGTWLVVAISYAAIVLAVVVSAEISSLVRGVSLSSFYVAYAIPIWPFLILLVATAVGSGSVSDDLQSRSITLYLSRPIRLQDYVGAKVAAVGTWVGVTAIGPGLVGVTILAALGLSSLSVSVAAFGVFLALGLLTTFFFTGLSIGLSALTSRALYSGVGIFGITLSAEIVAAAVSGATGNSSVLYISPVDDIEAAASAAFQSGSSTSIDPWAASAVLVGAGAVLFAIAWLRLKRVEVVGE